MFFCIGTLLFLGINRFLSEIENILYGISSDKNGLAQSISSFVSKLGNISSHLPFFKDITEGSGLAIIGEQIDDMAIEIIKEMEKYADSDRDYTPDSIVGKSGIEQYMESELQGLNGEKQIVVNNVGKVVGEENIIKELLFSYLQEKYIPPATSRFSPALLISPFSKRGKKESL